MESLTKIALDYSNKIREKLNLPRADKLESGYIAHTGMCPVANTIKMNLSNDYEVMVLTSRVIIFMPDPFNNGDTYLEAYHTEEIKDFIDRFDSGDYPELCLGDYLAATQAKANYQEPKMVEKPEVAPLAG